jgi:hypothetical protein
MPIEKIRDNQWWYSKSALRDQVVHSPYLMLSIGGRDCPMEHSEVGKDGRVTHSFRFVRPTDREFWRSLLGQEVEICVTDVRDSRPDVDGADEPDDETAPDDGAAAPAFGQMDARAPKISRSSGTLFDAYIFVDWSARSQRKTGKDSIWIAKGEFDGGVLSIGSAYNAPTRQAGETFIECELLRLTRDQRRVLVGFDFPYGYPEGWHGALGVPPAAGTWQDLWNALSNTIQDDATNGNNRCVVANNFNASVPNYVGPYWTRPNQLAGLPNLPATKPGCFANATVREYREIEKRLLAQRRQPKSVWQLYGSGSVGSQSLLGIPAVKRLSNSASLRACSQVWPFQTGWACPEAARPLVIHAEIWPGAIDVDLTAHRIKDAAQMLSYVRWAAGLDVLGLLTARFNPFFGGTLPAAAVQTTEGWILS